MIEINDVIKKAKESQDKLNAFVTILDGPTQECESSSLLSGMPIAIKDNFSTKDILSTGSSNTLKDYVPFWDATVIKKIKESGMIIIGKTAMDELGMGGTGTTAHTGIVKNPWDLTCMTAGSSAGSAAAVAAGIVPFALGSDTGDSVRKPAAWCGIVGFKPTYGLISRYGLFPFACSLDHVGTFARNIKDVAILTDAIKGIDKYDMTTWDSSNISLFNSLTGNVENKKLCYIKEIVDLNSYKNPSDELKEMLEVFYDTLDKCRDLGIEVSEISIDKKLLNAIFPTYQCISCAEATSNYSNLTGISFGPRGSGNTIDEVMKDHRTKGFSTLIKRRFIIGSYALQKENQEKFFINAQRARRLIVDEMNKLFEKFDGLILPCSEAGAKKIVGDEKITQETESMLSVLESHLAIGNFGGFPSVTFPNGFVNELPIGVNITGKIMDDENILNIAYAIENTMDFKDQIAKGWQ